MLIQEKITLQKTFVFNIFLEYRPIREVIFKTNDYEKFLIKLKVIFKYIKELEIKHIKIDIRI